jgi:membrane protease YdiL (CAAX protease family)
MLFYLLLFFIPNFLISRILSEIDSSGGLLSLRAFLNYTRMVILLVLAGWVCLRLIDRRPFVLFGLPLSWKGLKNFFAGFGIGAAIFIVTFGILWLSGWQTVENFDLGKAFQGVFWRYFLVFFIAALLEELTARGYLFQALAEGTRPWIAALVFSLLFSLGHWDNTAFAWSGALSIFILGLLCAVAVLKTRSLWTVTGLHMAWNWMQGSVFGMNVSGHTMQDSLFSTVPSGPVLLSGGGFGAEGSLITSFVAAIALVYMLKTRWIKPSQAAADAWDHYPAGFRKDPKTG